MQSSIRGRQQTGPDGCSSSPPSHAAAGTGPTGRTEEEREEGVGERVRRQEANKIEIGQSIRYGGTRKSDASVRLHLMHLLILVPQAELSRRGEDEKGVLAGEDRG